MEPHRIRLAVRLRPGGYDKSTTELEYRTALAAGKPCLIFLLDEEAPWPRRFVDRGAEAEKIGALRAELAERHVCDATGSCRPRTSPWRAG